MRRSQVENKETVVIALDFDDMLADGKYREKLQELVNVASPKPLSERDYRVLAKFIVQQHHDFFMTILNDPEKNYVLISASNRQSLHAEINNATVKQNGFSFPVFEVLGYALAQQSNCHVETDKFLYSDMMTDREPGNTFDLGTHIAAGLDARDTISDRMKLDAAYKGKDKAEVVSTFNQRKLEPEPDSEKILLLYYQMWEMAARTNGTATTFVYADDHPRNVNTVLNYFDEHPEMIPPGMTLSVCLHNSIQDKHINDMIMDLPGGFTQNNSNTYTWSPIVSTAMNNDIDYIKVLRDTDQAWMKNDVESAKIPTILLGQHLTQQRAPMQKIAVEAILHILQSSVFESKKSSGVNELYSYIYTNINKLDNGAILRELKEIAESKNRSPREALAAKEGMTAAGKQMMRGIKLWVGEKTGKSIVDEESKALYDLLANMNPDNPKEFLGASIAVGDIVIKLPNEKVSKPLQAASSRFHQPHTVTIMNQNWKEFIKFLSKAEYNSNKMKMSIDPVIKSQGLAWVALQKISNILKKDISSIKNSDVALFIVECRNVRDLMKNNLKASPYSDLNTHLENIFSSDFIKDAIYSKVDPTSSKVAAKFREEVNANVEQRRHSFQAKI